MSERRALLDANLALLLTVGETNPDYISEHKRLSAYEARDYKLLVDTLRGYRGILFLPHVLTETSNLLRYASEPRRSQFSDTLRRIILNSSEQYVPSATAASSSYFFRLGLTDSALIGTASASNILITSDFDAYIAALVSGGDPVNFNHLRASAFNL